MTKFICKILYRDLEANATKTEYGLVEEEQVFSLKVQPTESHNSDFICVERTVSGRIIAIPINLISDIRVFDEIDHFTIEKPVAEVS